VVLTDSAWKTWGIDKLKLSTKISATFISCSHPTFSLMSSFDNPANLDPKILSNDPTMAFFRSTAAQQSEVSES